MGKKGLGANCAAVLAGTLMLAGSANAGNEAIEEFKWNPDNTCSPRIQAMVYHVCKNNETDERSDVISQLCEIGTSATDKELPEYLKKIIEESGETVSEVLKGKSIVYGGERILLNDLDSDTEKKILESLSKLSLVVDEITLERLEKKCEEMDPDYNEVWDACDIGATAVSTALSKIRSEKAEKELARLVEIGKKLEKEGVEKDKYNNDKKENIEKLKNKVDDLIKGLLTVAN